MKPEADESLLGFMKRSAAELSFIDVADYFQVMGFNYGRPMVEDLPGLSNALGLEVGELEGMLPSADPDDPALSWSYHRMQRDPVCPICLREGKPRRKEWRHSLVSTCAEHECRLIDECGGCGQALSLTWGSNTGCHCGTSFAAQPIVPASEIEIAVARLVGGMPTKMAGIEFTAREDRDAVKTLWFLASSMKTARTGKTGKSQIPKTVQEVVEFLWPVEEILTVWPHAFDHHVIDRWNDPEAEGMTAAQRLGPWYRALLAQRGVLAEALLAECLQVVAHTCGDAYKLGRVDGESQWMSAAEAGRSLGIRADRLVEAVRSGALVGRQSTSGTAHRHTVVRAADVAAIGRERNRFIGKSEARAFLGLSKKQFDLVQESGAIPLMADARWQSLVDGSIDRKALQATVDAIRAPVTVRRPQGANVAMVAFRDLNLKRTTDRTALLDVFRKVFAGEIRPVGFGGEAQLADAMFDAEEVAGHLKQGGAARSWTANDVSQITGWKPETVAHWCEQGLLLAERGTRGSLPVWQINERDLADFQARYSVVADIARDAGTSPRHLMKLLSEAGIRTHGAKAVGSTSRGHLVRTSELLLGLGCC